MDEVRGPTDGEATAAARRWAWWRAGREPERGRDRWSRLVTWFGLAFSLFVHLAVLVTFATVLGPARGNDGSGDAGPVQLALMPSAELNQLETAALTDSLVAESLDMPVEAFELSTMPEVPVGLSLADVALSDLVDFGGAASVDIASGAMVPSSGDSGTSFFGVEARGSRIAYIVDVSGSMAGDGRLATLKSQLIASIDDLPEHANFVIVAYSSTPRSLMGRRWTPATASNKEVARAEIGVLSPQGGTVPLPAFAGVFDLSPRPDAIYFMTDGEFGADQSVFLVRDIEAWNNRARRRTPIYCITFGSDSARSVMERIAERSGGTYTHVEAAP